MIQRHWKATLEPARLPEYLRHLRSETFPALSSISGFLGAAVMSRAGDDGPVRVLVVTEWVSMAAIAGFAGDDHERAVVPAAVQALTVEHDLGVEHYEVVAVHPGGGGTAAASTEGGPWC